MSFDTVPPEAHPSITADAVLELVRTQAPEFAWLELGGRSEGWDCANYRLGEELMVRLPRTEHAVKFLLAETAWVPILGAEWDFPHPVFPFLGEPGAGYPWPWAIVSWVPGDMAVDVPLASSEGAALGRALAQVHQPAPPDAPLNDEQSIPMAEREERTLRRIAALADAGGPNGERLDAGAAREVWAAASAVPDPRRDQWVWSHADLHGANVLSLGGRFGGIVDWGSMAACDPAVDLGFAHSLTTADGVAAMLAEYGALTGRVDDALEARMRGIGLAKSVGIAMSDTPATKAMGWRGLDALGLVR